MANKDKKADSKAEKAEVKTKEFTLKKSLGDKSPGDKVKFGPKGERFYKFNGTI